MHPVIELCYTVPMTRDDAINLKKKYYYYRTAHKLLCTLSLAEMNLWHSTNKWPFLVGIQLDV